MIFKYSRNCLNANLIMGCSEFSLLQYKYFIMSFQHTNQNLPSSNEECEKYPCDTIIRIEDSYFSMVGYFQTHDVKFQLPQVTYGNQQVRKYYNITKELKKYFGKRYFFFSLFDQGIQLDNESWYSVVAEPISLYLCERLKFSGVKTLLQPFCGVGGISVHAAGNFQQLVVNDIDINKIKMLKNNLQVYGKGLNLLSIHNKDALKIKPYQVDAVVICPPWGGVNISEYSFRDLDQIMEPKLSDILNHFKQFSRNIVLQMPKNTNFSNLLKIINMCFLTPIVKIEKICVDGRVSQLFVYIGDVKFTAFNPQVFNVILKDSKMQINNVKQMKKDIKKKFKQQKFDIFSQIYQKSRVKLNSHIFFDQSSSH